jgi:hypothetical protein
MGTEYLGSPWALESDGQVLQLIYTVDLGQLRIRREGVISHVNRGVHARIPCVNLN